MVVNAGHICISWFKKVTDACYLGISLSKNSIIGACCLYISLFKTATDACYLGISWSKNSIIGVCYLCICLSKNSDGDTCYLFISWSKNSYRCLIPFVSTGLKKKLQMLPYVSAGPKTVTDACYLRISRSKNSDRCLIPYLSDGLNTVTDAWYLLYQQVKRKSYRCFLIFESAIPKAKTKFLVNLSYFYTRIHCDREFSIVSNFATPVFVLYSYNINCRLSSFLLYRMCLL